MSQNQAIVVGGCGVLVDLDAYRGQDSLSDLERRRLTGMLRYHLSETCSAEQLMMVATIIGVGDALPERYQSVVRRRGAYITGVIEAIVSLFKGV